MNKILYIALTAAIFAGCSKENPEPQGGRIAAQFSDAAISRATATAWEAGDKIGVYMVNAEADSLGNDSVVDEAKNVSHTVMTAGATGTFTPTTATETIYYPVNGDKVDMYAYYPWTETTIGGIYKVDVSNQTTHSAIDLMAAKVSAKSKSDPAVAFSFAHQLAKLSLTIKTDGELTPAELEGLTVKIVGLSSTADYNLANGTISNLGTAADITANTTTNGNSASAILIPTTLTSEAKVVFTLADKAYFVWKITKPSLVGGNNYHYNVTLNRTIGVAITSQGITDWTVNDHGNIPMEEKMEYAIGDLYPDAIAPIGVVFWVDPSDATSGKIVGLTEAIDKKWGIVDVLEESTDIDSTTNGASATKNMIKAYKDETYFADNYSAFEWVYTTANGGNIDGRWYIPAKDELVALYSGKTFVNTSLATVSGAAPLSDEAYWSSTQRVGNNAWRVTFDDGYTTGGTKDDGNSVRVVSVF